MKTTELFSKCLQQLSTLCSEWTERDMLKRLLGSLTARIVDFQMHGKQRWWSTFLPFIPNTQDLNWFISEFVRFHLVLSIFSFNFNYISLSLIWHAHQFHFIHWSIIGRFTATCLVVHLYRYSALSLSQFHLQCNWMILKLCIWSTSDFIGEREREKDCVCTILTVAMNAIPVM